MKSQNAKRRQTGGNQNDEESNSQANKRDKTVGEDSSRMENELRNMRKKMDELRSAIKDKGGENLDGMIRRTNSLFTTKVLTVPYHRNSVSHSWNHITVPRIPWITLNHSRHWCCCRWSRWGDVQGIPNDNKRSSQSVVQQDTPRNKWRSVDSLKLDSCSTDSYLSRFNEARQILSIEVSIEVTRI